MKKLGYLVSMVLGLYFGSLSAAEAEEACTANTCSGDWGSCCLQCNVANPSEQEQDSCTKFKAACAENYGIAQGCDSTSSTICECVPTT